MSAHPPPVEDNVKSQAAVLGAVWFLTGGMVYAVLFALAWALGGRVSAEPEPDFQLAFLTTICGLPFPLLFGWVPAALRLVRGRPRPWTSAIVMAIVALAMSIAAAVALFRA